MRNEFSAKLSAAEARMERRVTRIEGYTRAISEDIREMRAENKETLRKIADLKTTIVTTAIATALAIVFGVASFNAALTSNILTALQAGLQGAQSAAHQAGASPASRQDSP